MACQSDTSSDSLIHRENTNHRYAFKNINKIDIVYNAKNLSWQGIDNAITTEKNRELFDTDHIIQSNIASDDSTTISIQVNKYCKSHRQRFKY